MHPEGLAKSTAAIFVKLAKLKQIGQFYLAGGTACALHYGHRYSHDLDFFTEKTFDHLKLADDIAKLGKFQVDTLEEETLLGHLDDVKVSFFRYRYPLIAKTKRYTGVFIADVPDLAAMKIEAIGSRGKKRDFIDLYVITHNTRWPLDKSVKHFQKKYTKLDLNIAHALKSLIYFQDADEDEMPEMILPIKWQDVKNYFRSEVQRIGKKLLGV